MPAAWAADIVRRAHTTRARCSLSNNSTLQNVLAGKGCTQCTNGILLTTYIIQASGRAMMIPQVPIVRADLFNSVCDYGACVLYLFCIFVSVLRLCRRIKYSCYRDCFGVDFAVYALIIANLQSFPNSETLLMLLVNIYMCIQFNKAR